MDELEKAVCDLILKAATAKSADVASTYAQAALTVATVLEALARVRKTAGGGGCGGV